MSLSSILFQIKLPLGKTGTTPQSSPGGSMGQSQQFDKDGAPIYPPRHPSSQSSQNPGQNRSQINSNNNTPNSTGGANIPKVLVLLKLL